MFRSGRPRLPPQRRLPGRPIAARRRRGALGDRDRREPVRGRADLNVVRGPVLKRLPCAGRRCRAVPIWHRREPPRANRLPPSHVPWSVDLAERVVDRSRVCCAFLEAWVELAVVRRAVSPRLFPAVTMSPSSSEMPARFALEKVDGENSRCAPRAGARGYSARCRCPSCTQGYSACGSTHPKRSRGQTRNVARDVRLSATGGSDAAPLGTTLCRIPRTRRVLAPGSSGCWRRPLPRQAVAGLPDDASAARAAPPPVSILQRAGHVRSVPHA